MPDRIAVEFNNVGKMYRLYRSRLETLLELTSLGHLIPGRSDAEKFWAVRNLSFSLKAGARLGVVGRNGAGKTTLLKLIIGNILPTEGRVKVDGAVQALLEAGVGFHPEFSGYENVAASLTQNGVDAREIKAELEEIIEFTELADFMGQPFKTYSSGMQARLVFATATAIRPEILIVDEILGAGDAYFAVKANARMQRLVDSGASVVLVSHSMAQVLQFCDEAIWLERGIIVQHGPCLDVVKAYEEFVHVIQNRQLKTAGSSGRRFREAIKVDDFESSSLEDELGRRETESGGERTASVAIHPMDTDGQLPGGRKPKPKVARWPGEGSLLIDDLLITDANGEKCEKFPVGRTLNINIMYHAVRKGSFPVIFGIALYRLDGLKISQHTSRLQTVDMDAGEKRSVMLHFPSIDIADGRYLITASLHRELDPYHPNETVRYDLLAYSFEFEIVGNDPARSTLFVLPANWKVAS